MQKSKTMFFKITIILFFVFISATNLVLAQQKPTLKDTTRIYTTIQTYSGRSKFTKFMYSLIFKPVKLVSPKGKTKKKVYRKLIKKPYSAFEGKVIRHINIETLDPFGYSIVDTIEHAQNYFSRTGNKLHIKSQNITIRNLLLIHQNQRFDSLLVKESERLVRSRKYIRDVSFLVKNAGKGSDSVDIFIRELDIWSIIPKGGSSLSHTTVNLADKNFMGLGHEFQSDFTRDYVEKDNAFHANYTIPNIKNTFVSSTIHYGVKGDKNFNKSLSFDRPFFSPLAKWAAGINFTQQFFNDSVPIDNFQSDVLRYKYNSQDYWAGNAIRLYKGKSEYDRTTNFITAIRFFRIHYLEKPNQTFDIQHQFSDEKFYLTIWGISTRGYVQDKFIFKYGITEDVPIGKIMSLTTGYQVKSNTERLYLGARVSFGCYYPWGYLSPGVEYGTFIRASKLEEGVFTVNATYFTGLIEFGKWKFRQFAKPQFTIGINRFASDSLTLNDGNGLNGFHSNVLKGTKRMLLTMQTQSYAPWNFIGFRFGPFFSYSMGILGNEISGFKKSKIYSQIGIGVLIKNENLVLNTFQISLSFYPIIPGNGNNIIKINSLSTTDFGFQDFEIGKPEPVVFR